MIKNEEHPLMVYKSICNRFYQKDIKFEFSKYIYINKGITESREIFYIEPSNLTMEWLKETFTELIDGQELACHSRVTTKKGTLHIPFIDFQFQNIKDFPSKEINSIALYYKTNFYLFSSGSSFHGYFDVLISEMEWYKFLGEILLLNDLPNYNQRIVDSRWVGHSLKHSFGSLRWSNKTKKAIPTLAKY
jgi:hypothetical protein